MRAPSGHSSTRSRRPVDRQRTHLHRSCVFDCNHAERRARLDLVLQPLLDHAHQTRRLELGQRRREGSAPSLQPQLRRFRGGAQQRVPLRLGRRCQRIARRLRQRCPEGGQRVVNQLPALAIVETVVRRLDRSGAQTMNRKRAKRARRLILQNCGAAAQRSRGAPRRRHRVARDRQRGRCASHRSDVLRAAARSTGSNEAIIGLGAICRSTSTVA